MQVAMEKRNNCCKYVNGMNNFKKLICNKKMEALASQLAVEDIMVTKVADPFPIPMQYGYAVGKNFPIQKNRF